MKKAPTFSLYRAMHNTLASCKETPMPAPTPVLLGTPPITVPPGATVPIVVLPSAIVRIGKLRVGDDQHAAAGRLLVPSVTIGQEEQWADPHGDNPPPLAVLLPMTADAYAAACQAWRAAHPDAPEDGCDVDEGGVSLDGTLYPNVPLTVTVHNPTREPIAITLAVDAHRLA